MKTLLQKIDTNADEILEKKAFEACERWFPEEALNQAEEANKKLMNEPVNEHTKWIVKGCISAYTLIEFNVFKADMPDPKCARSIRVESFEKTYLGPSLAP